MTFVDRLVAWWQGGDAIMLVITAIGTLLYTHLVARTMLLFGMGEGAAAGATLPGASRAPPAGAGQPGFIVARALIASLPLTGLAGTVSGMIEVFAALNGGGAGAVRDASRGISLALIATQYGLALAIPAMVWLWLLEQRARTMQAAQRRQRHAPHRASTGPER